MLKKYLPVLVLVLFSIPLFFLHIHKEHHWGDDFAMYIMQAKSIAEGKPYYESKYIFNPYNPEFGPPQYPPGFPYMLAPVVKKWGVDILAMNYFMSFLLACILFILYAYYRKYAGPLIAICLAVICVYAGGIMESKPQVLSDFPSWIFIALYLVLRQREQYSAGKIILMILLMTAAILTRTQSVLVLLAEGVYLGLLTIKKWYKEKRLDLKAVFTSASFIVSVGSVALFLALNSTVFSTPQSTLSFYSNLTTHRANSLWVDVSNNASYNFQIIMRAFHYYSPDTFLNVLTEATAYIIFTFAIIGYFMALKKRLNIEDVYFTVLLVFLCFFTGYQGVRFIFSILPIYLLYAYWGMKSVIPSLLNAHKRPKMVAVSLTIIYLYFGWRDFDMRAGTFKDRINNTLFPEDLTAYEYIKNNVKDDKIIVFRKARCLALFADKLSVTDAPQVSAEMNKHFFDSLKVDYVLTCSDFDNSPFYTYMQMGTPPLDTTYINDSYTLYRLK